MTNLIAKKDGGQKICHFVKLDFQRSKSTVAKNSCRVSQGKWSDLIKNLFFGQQMEKVCMSAPLLSFCMLYYVLYLL